MRAHPQATAMKRAAAFQVTLMNSDSRASRPTTAFAWMMFWRQMQLPMVAPTVWRARRWSLLRLRRSAAIVWTEPKVRFDTVVLPEKKEPRTPKSGVTKVQPYLPKEVMMGFAMAAATPAFMRAARTRADAMGSNTLLVRFQVRDISVGISRHWPKVTSVMIDTQKNGRNAGTYSTSKVVATVGSRKMFDRPITRADDIHTSPKLPKRTVSRGFVAFNSSLRSSSGNRVKVRKNTTSPKGITYFHVGPLGI
mmetsp:Transcript_8071/g.26508  ORF Transcript_8071/g.26508 Transcript_8071/m.26508 type:complete len:251 (+) Transcript_8071:750-1502(+)